MRGFQIVLLRDPSPMVATAISHKRRRRRPPLSSLIFMAVALVVLLPQGGLSASSSSSNSNSNSKHSARSSSTTSTSHPLMEALQTRLLSKQPTSKPFSNRHPTRVSGYGSRQYYRQLRQRQAGASTPLSQQQKQQPTSKKTNTKNKKKGKKDKSKVQTLSAPSLVLYPTVFDNESGGDDDDGDSSTNSTTTTAASWMVLHDEYSDQTLRIGADLQVEETTTTIPQSTINNNHHIDEPRPIQGLWGVYTLPSGHLWVWITDSQPVFTSLTPTANDDDDDNNDHPYDPTSSFASWFPLRRVTEVYLHFVPSSASGPLSDNHSRAASIVQRQVGLLRQALKDHEWYYCDDASRRKRSDEDSTIIDFKKDDNATTNSFVVTDATFNLQHCVQRYQRQQRENDNGEDNDVPHESSSSSMLPWWKQYDNNDQKNPWYPDSRFFWNEGALDAFMKNANTLEEEDSSYKNRAFQTLLSWSIPITSAFVSVQSNLSLADEETTTNKNEEQEDGHNRYHQILISRRSKLRAGTRFTKRGADATGHVANYAETEQIVIVDKPPSKSTHSNHTRSSSYSQQHICSHVQTRGSIPLRWSSPTDIKTYRPRVRIGTDPLAQARAMRQHLVDQIGRYIHDDDSDLAESTQYTCPRFVFVNLVDKHGDQGRLGRAMDSVMQAILDVHEKQQKDLASIRIVHDESEHPTVNGQTGEETDEIDLPKRVHEDDDDSFTVEDTPAEYKHLNTNTIRHEWYDFHAEVKGGRWDRLRSLLDTVDPSLEEQGFFETVFDGDKWKIQRLQTGVVRTNCMDCLDRTNVVQSIFARRVLFAQLEAVTKISKSFAKSFRLNPLSLPWAAGEVAHRLLWADNADAISRLYAGTPALKGDFTRTGKRTKRGALDDGVNSIQRYYLNNFLDADRQEGMDLLTMHEEFTDILSESEQDLTKVTAKKEKKNGSGMSIQDAARDLLLGGTWGSLVESKEKGRNGDGDDDESDHVRAKIGDGNRGGAFSKKNSNTLNFSWLPGDLQAQMRSLATFSTSGEDQQFNLKSMDDRTAQDLPWWTLGADDSTSEEGSSITQTDTSSTSSSISKGDLDNAMDANHAGFVLAALVAGTKAPLATAAMVLGIAGLSLAGPTTNDDDISENENENEC